MNNSIKDVVIAGAGPAGTALATFLAQAGLDVEVLEKTHFPRFHIGESLLPLGVTVLKELGLELDSAPYALRKAGSKIYCEVTGERYRVAFENALDGVFPYAYQVERAHFDQALAQKAEAAGAHVRFGWQVRKLSESSDSVAVSTADAQVKARYFVDATGQGALLSRIRGARRWVRGIGRCGTFTHFANVRSQAAREAFSDGDILLILCPNDAWAWAIPLPGGKASIGVVHKDGSQVQSPGIAFDHFLEGCPWLRSILEGAERVEAIHRVSNYSYYNDMPHSARTVCVGDAHAFLDPVFSSGVSLGLYAAKALAQVMIPQVRADQALQLEAYEEQLKQGYEAFESLISRFYRPGWARNTFFQESKPQQMVRELNTMLAGDVWRNDNDWQNQMVRGRRRNIRYEAEALSAC